MLSTKENISIQHLVHLTDKKDYNLCFIYIENCSNGSHYIVETK